MTPKIGDRVTLHWEDARAADDWKLLTDAHEWGFASVESTGVLVYQDKDKVTVAQTLNPAQKEAADTITIPAKWVTRIVVLNEAFE